MKSLKQFAGYQEVFKTPQHLPEFFQQNLVDPARVVKVFQDDPQAHLRVFYYQYLKLCFELNSPKSEELVQKIEELINNPTFQFIFYQEDDPSLFNDTQAKAFISEFFGELSSSDCTVLEAINSYPIMDIIMVHFFRTLLVLMDKTESLDSFIPRDQVLSFLCPFFGIDVEIHDSCVKYVDSDVFVFDQTERIVYLAYINYTEDASAPIESQELSSQEVIQQYNSNQYNSDQYGNSQSYNNQHSSFAPQSTVSHLVEEPKQEKKIFVQAKQSYIASQWNDYTYADSAPGKLAEKGTALKGSDHQIEPVAKSEVERVPLSNGFAEKTQLHSLNSQPFVETASISSGSGDKQVQESLSQGTYGYGQVDYLAKSNPVSKPIVVPPPPPPTATAISSTTQLHSVSPSLPSYQPASQPVPTKDNSEYSKINNYMSSAYEPPKVKEAPAAKPFASPSYESSLGKDFGYQPKVESYKNSEKFEYQYTSSETTSKVQYGEGQGAAYGGVSSSVTVGKKKPFGLNVSDEFTNSWTIKKMAEPFKSNVTNIKSRARQYRNSLTPFIK